MKTHYFKQDREEGAWRLMKADRTIHNSTPGQQTGSARMNGEHAPTTVTESLERHSSARLHGRWLLLARVGWVALVVLTLAIFGASLPVYIALQQTTCAGSACAISSNLSIQLTPSQVGALTGIGLSLGAYAAFTVALTFAQVVVCLVVSTVIVWRRSDDRMALFVALMLVTFGPLAETGSVVAIPSPLQVPNECLYFLALALLVLVFLLFPSGQFVPHWMRWTMVVFLAWLVPEIFVAPAMPNTPVDQLTSLVSLGVGVMLAIVQLYRYRRVSSPLQRQQTKWVVFGIAVLITVSVSGSVLELIFSALSSPGSLYPLAQNVVFAFLPLFIPLSFGFAMLRSRLWEIDVLINRTLVYGTLTVSLALVYFSLVISLQSLVRLFTGQLSQSPVIIVASTLAIAALFEPLRHGIQAIIDRRFYRRKYDAAKIIEAFSATLRQEVDLNQLSEQLVAVIQETMQPTCVSLWLSPPAHAGTQRAPWRATLSGSSEGR